ncbi:HIT domain-containing protein [Candidatus Woesearchaeota archaeon]|nr:HIT domain-containing protein [Candidatus Woesearchaeota archaeon]
MNNSNCIFCKIVQCEIPALKVYEDEHFFAFLDIRPLNKGHTLLIPKTHYRWMWDIPDDYSKSANKIVLAIKHAFETDYVQALVVGEEVEHAHLHLIPRFLEDGHGSVVNPQNIKNFSMQEMKSFTQKIKENLR